MTTRPRRSLLYMPGSNARALEKARTLPADGLILDLEDAVAPDAKELARGQVCDAVTAGGYGTRELLVRINGLETPWGHDDIKALAGVAHAIDAILIPKVSIAEDVQEAVAAFQASNTRTSVDFWIMTETPHSILNIREIAASHERLKGIVMGTSDLAKDTRVRHTPERLGFICALSLCVLAARANGLQIVDGVHLDLDDDEGLRNVCQQARDLGFDGKSLIHPKQIAPANDAFAPRPEEIESAREIIEAWETGQSEGKGVVVVRGRLVENLHVEEAKRTLELAEAIAGMNV